MTKYILYSIYSYIDLIKEFDKTNIYSPFALITALS